ncbi:hypothetical protein ABY45_14710 [Microbacterium maritypicum]|uniref:hypothetical protein n=1 Tax=Microbacterium maritypicum TaxID=33918 RepID=UPI003D6F8E61
MSAAQPAAKLAESIPAVTAPVKLPSIVPPRVNAWAVAGAALFVPNVVLAVVAVNVS